jgi:GntR family transcriptional regulator
LPTVKALALELTVNPNTVARAYRDLERDEVIETSPGRGSFVKHRDGAAPLARRALAEVAAGALEAAIRDARSIGVSRPELTALIATLVARWYPTENE